MTEANGASTESKPEPKKPAAIVPVDEGAAISAFASDGNFRTAQRMAQALAQSEILPGAYRGNLPNILIALDLASRIGASVLAVMQNLDIIHGNPSWRSKFLIATVNTKGEFTKLRFRWQGVEGTDSWGCRCVAKDKETQEECLGPLVTVALARKKGWWDRKGSAWPDLTELMLIYRSAAFWTRVYAPEISLGMNTSEEAHDMQDERIEVRNLVPMPHALIPGSSKELEADLLGTPIEKAKPIVLDMKPLQGGVDYHPDTGEVVPQ